MEVDLPLSMNKSENIMNIVTKRGFFFPNAEIYGSKSGFWTYGHLGTLMKHRLENLWRNSFIKLSENYFEIEDCNILPKAVFKSSGHLENFNDPLTECKTCHFRFRADELIEDNLNLNVAGVCAEDIDKIIRDNKLKCPKCNSELDKVRFFNMMFDVRVGATGEEIMYLRPETAQSAYLAFKREFEALRKKLPFGLAVIGKAFRNEISPRQGFFRLREFTQAELQIFFDADKIDSHEGWDLIKDHELYVLFENERGINKIKASEVNTKHKIPKFYVYHLIKIQEFYLNVLKIPYSKFRFRQLSEKERAFYNKIHFDIELDLETFGGFKEVAGLHYRGDHDLKGHQDGSKEKLEVTVDEKKVLPHVLELSFGIDRNIWALLDVFYKEENERTFFKFPGIISPLDVAIFPLVNKDDLDKKALEIYKILKDKFTIFYDDSGSIGRRYRRIDEIGCRIGITVDYETMKDNTVTLRDRDSMKQIRVRIEDLEDVILKLLNEEKLEKFGKIIN